MPLLPFERIWSGVKLINYRDGKGTYLPCPLDTVPPIPLSDLDGSYSWLHDTPSPSLQDESDNVKFDARLERQQQRAKELNLTLPKEYLSLLSNKDLRSRVKSITGSFWKLDSIEQCPISDGYLALCRSDSQASLLWYLYLDSSTSNHCVIATVDYFGADVASYGELDLNNLSEIHLCAVSFEEFVYREWIEHSAAYHLMTAKPLTDREKSYVDHYRPPGDKSDRRIKCEIHECPLEPGELLWLGTECRSIQWNGNYPEGLGQLPLRAGLFQISHWRKDESVTVVPDRAYCPVCRTEMMQKLKQDGLRELTELLADRLELGTR